VPLRLNIDDLSMAATIRAERGTGVPTDNLKSTRLMRGAPRSLTKTSWIRVRFSE